MGHAASAVWRGVGFFGKPPSILFVYWVVQKYCFHLLLLAVVISLAVTSLGVSNGMLTICQGDNGRVALEKSCSRSFCPLKSVDASSHRGPSTATRMSPSCRDTNLLAVFQIAPSSDVSVTPGVESLCEWTLARVTPLFRPRLAAYLVPHSPGTPVVDSVILII